MPVIPTTWEAEIVRTEVQNQHRKKKKEKVSETPISTNSLMGDMCLSSQKHKKRLQSRL
jgi:hypothetical protein